MDLRTEILCGFQRDRLWSGLPQTISYPCNLTQGFAELASRLDALKTGLDIPPATVQAVTSDLSRLAKSLSDATGSLPSYDQRQCELVSSVLSRQKDSRSSYQTATQGTRENHRRASRGFS
jgi:hypothetical protein